MPDEISSQFFTQDELKELYEAFTLCARDGIAIVDDLKVSLGDLQHTLQATNDPALELGSGLMSTVLSVIPIEQVTFQQLVGYIDTYLAHGDHHISQAEMSSIFLMLSQNGKYITLSTLKAASSELDLSLEHDLAGMLEYAGGNNGQIDFYQFKSMMMMPTHGDRQQMNG